MRKLYFLVPELDTVKKIVDELLLLRIPEHHIHVFARDDSLLHKNNVPAAGLLQISDLLPSVIKGGTAGGVVGLLAGLAAVMFPPSGLALGGGTVAVTTIAGAGFGSLVSPMIGVSVPNPKIKKYEDAIRKGQFMMIIDINKRNVKKISALVKTHHPEVTIENTGSRLGLFT